MMHAALPIWSLFGVVGCVLLGWFLFHPREGLVERRRRRSHHRVVTKATRPMVKFSVRTPKEK
jgi:hypothetical protein